MANTRSTVFKAGMEEGRAQVHKAAVDWLENRLVNDRETRPDRGSPEYEFGLELTREFLKFVRELELK